MENANKNILYRKNQFGDIRLLIIATVGDIGIEDTKSESILRFETIIQSYNTIYQDEPTFLKDVTKLFLQELADDIDNCHGTIQDAYHEAITRHEEISFAKLFTAEFHESKTIQLITDLLREFWDCFCLQGGDDSYFDYNPDYLDQISQVVYLMNQNSESNAVLNLFQETIKQYREDEDFEHWWEEAVYGTTKDVFNMK